MMPHRCSAVRTMARSLRKSEFNKLGYGALALYAVLLVAMALGIYGFNVTSVIMDQDRSDRTRAQVRTGRVLLTSADRSQCRSIRFDNETAELSRETLVECDSVGGVGSGSSFSVFRNGFVNRR
jgi:hypothetical protein